MAALAVRLLYLWQISAAPFYGLRIGDAEAYHLWAQRIVAGDWLGSGVFYQAPLYPYALALIYWLLGDGVTPVRVVQAIAGASSCVLLAAAGMRLFGRHGALAGVALAIFPPALFLEGQLDKTSFSTLFMTALLLALVYERWLCAGILLGLLALTRENALILALPVFARIAAGPVSQPRKKAALAVAAGCFLTLLPVAIRNTVVGGEFQITTAQFGPNFYIGNHPRATGSYEALVTGHGNAADEREDATRLAEEAVGHKLSATGVSGYWTGRALDYIRSQPINWVALIVRKVALALNSAEVADTESQDVYAEWSWLLRIPFDFGVVLALAVFGVSLGGGAWRRSWLLFGIAAAYIASVVLFYVLARYRFPLVPVLLLLAASPLAAAWKQLPGRRVGIANALAAAALVLSYLPLDDPRSSRATHYFAIGAALAKDPQHAGTAAEFYRRALNADPQFPAAQFGLATLLTRDGRRQEAVPLYRAALASWPDYEEARVNLGIALTDLGQPEEAVEQFTDALRLRPDDLDARLALAKALLTLQHPERAAEQYRKCLESNPQNGSAHVGLGVALTQLGRIDEAIHEYQRALAINADDAAAHNSFGWTLANAGRVAEAIPHFERAVQLNPEDPNLIKNLEAAQEIQKKK